MNVLELALKRVVLKKVAPTHGGEWQGPCPGCGGEDRFHVWPEENEGTGSYWCRPGKGCGKYGDNIQFLRDFEGMGFKEACAYLKVDVPDRPEGYRPPSPRQKKPEFEPKQHIPPADLWQEKAEKFVSWAEVNLAARPYLLSWLSLRGIRPDVAINYRLGFNPGENGKDFYRPRKSWGLPEELKENGQPKKLWIPVGVVVPYIVDGVIYRIRIRPDSRKPPYQIVPGSSMATMVMERTRRAFVIVESELDAIAVAANNDLAGAVAVGSSSAKPDAETFALLQGALQILNALDYDAAGTKASAWWKEQFPRCDRWPVPKGKDPGEAYRAGIDLNEWVRQGLPPALTIAAPDRKKEAPVPGPAATKAETAAAAPPPDVAPEIRELLDLLRKNPAVKIVNTPNRFAVLRNDKWVGGRIGDLVFKVPAVRDYILAHPAQEIDAGNFLRRREENAT